MATIGSIGVNVEARTKRFSNQVRLIRAQLDHMGRRFERFEREGDKSARNVRASLAQAGAALNGLGDAGGAGAGLALGAGLAGAAKSARGIDPKPMQSMSEATVRSTQAMERSVGAMDRLRNSINRSLNPAPMNRFKQSVRSVENAIREIPAGLLGPKGSVAGALDAAGGHVNRFGAGSVSVLRILRASFVRLGASAQSTSSTLFLLSDFVGKATPIGQFLASLSDRFQSLSTELTGHSVAWEKWSRRLLKSISSTKNLARGLGGLKAAMKFLKDLLLILRVAFKGFVFVVGKVADGIRNFANDLSLPDRAGGKLSKSLGIVARVLKALGSDLAAKGMRDLGAEAIKASKGIDTLGGTVANGNKRKGKLMQAAHSVSRALRGMGVSSVESANKVGVLDRAIDLVTRGGEMLQGALSTVAAKFSAFTSGAGGLVGVMNRGQASISSYTGQLMGLARGFRLLSMFSVKALTPQALFEKIALRTGGAVGAARNSVVNYWNKVTGLGKGLRLVGSLAEKFGLGITETAASSDKAATSATGLDTSLKNVSASAEAAKAAIDGTTPKVANLDSALASADKMTSAFEQHFASAARKVAESAKSFDKAAESIQRANAAMKARPPSPDFGRITRPTEAAAKMGGFGARVDAPSKSAVRFAEMKPPEPTRFQKFADRVKASLGNVDKSFQGTTREAEMLRTRLGPFSKAIPTRYVSGAQKIATANAEIAATGPRITTNMTNAEAAVNRFAGGSLRLLLGGLSAGVVGLKVFGDAALHVLSPVVRLAAVVTGVPQALNRMKTSLVGLVLSAKQFISNYLNLIGILQGVAKVANLAARAVVRLAGKMLGAARSAAGYVTGIIRARMENRRLAAEVAAVGEKVQKQARSFRLGGREAYESFRLSGVGARALHGSLVALAKPLMLIKSMALPLATFAFLGTAVAGSEKFERSMNKSLAIMQATEGQQRRMEAEAKRVASSTVFSAQEAAESYFFLASAGFTAEESIGALEAVSKFGQAGLFEMQQATDLLTDSFSALGMNTGTAAQKMRKMVGLSDVLVRANELANASVEQFATALTTKVGAGLKVANKSVEEGVAVLAALADQGVKAEEAGTALSKFLSDLALKAGQNKDKFQELGLAVHDSQGNLLDLATIVDNITAKLGGMSDVHRANTLASLGFTKRSLDLANQLMGTGDAIRRYKSELEGAAGSTDRVAGKQMTEFQKGWEQFKVIILEVGQQAFQPLINLIGRGLTRAAGFFEKFMGKVKFVRDNWSTIWELMKTDAKIALAVAGELMLWFFEQVVGGVSGMGDAWSSIWDTLKAAAATALSGIQSFFRGILDGIVGYARGRLDALENFWFDLSHHTGDALRSMLDSARSIFSSIWNAIKSGLSGVVDLFRNFPDAVGGTIDLVKEFFTSGFDSIVDSMKKSTTEMGGLWGDFRAVAFATISAIGTFVTTIFEGMSATIKGHFGAVTSSWGALVGAIEEGKSPAQAIKAMGAARLKAEEDIVSFDFGAFGAAGQAAGEAYTSTFDALTTGAMIDLANAAKEKLGEAIAAVDPGLIARHRRLMAMLGNQGGDEYAKGIGAAISQAAMATENAAKGFNAELEDVEGKVGAIAEKQQGVAALLKGSAEAFSAEQSFRRQTPLEDLNDESRKQTTLQKEMVQQQKKFNAALEKQPRVELSVGSFGFR